MILAKHSDDLSCNMLTGTSIWFSKRNRINQWSGCFSFGISEALFDDDLQAFCDGSEDVGRRSSSSFACRLLCCDGSVLQGCKFIRCEAFCYNLSYEIVISKASIQFFE